MDKKSAIGIFDSGVGGLTVLKELIDLLPSENIIYYGDSGNSPYGDKSQEEIEKLCINIVDFLIGKKCKVVVIACNTATKAAINVLKEQYNLPIIGVIESGAKKAVEVSENNKIGILSTVFTAESNAYLDEVKKFSPNAEVYQKGCKDLCPMIENDWDTHANRMSVLEGYVSDLPEDIDTIVLGCTHYPMIINDIKKLVHGKIIIDPAKETSLTTKKVLESMNLLNDSKEKGEIYFYVSGDMKKFETIAERFLSMKIDKINSI